MITGELGRGRSRSCHVQLNHQPQESGHLHATDTSPGPNSSAEEGGLLCPSWEREKVVDVASDAVHLWLELRRLVAVSVGGSIYECVPGSCKSCRRRVQKQAAMSYLCRTVRGCKKSLENGLARISRIGQKSASVEEISTSPRVFWKWQWVLPRPFDRSSPSWGSVRF